MRAPLLPTTVLDIVQMDRQSLLARIQTLANQVDPQWQDFSPNFPENITLEAMALLCSMLADLINERARQLSLALVTDRLATIRITRLYGFQLTGGMAAQVSGTFYLPNSGTHAKDITIPAETRVLAGDAMYVLQTASSITTGNNASASVTLYNSELQTFVTTSDDTANIVLRLQNTPYIDDSISVVAANGSYSTTDGTGRKYTSFLDMGPETLGCIVMVDNNGSPYVFFGNGINGAIPSGSITIEYRTGGGEANRVEADYDGWKLQDTIVDVDGTRVTLLFSNSAASVGGYDQMTVEEARVQAPQALRTIESCVLEADFEYVATLTVGIARAACITSNQDTGIAENVGFLYVVAYGTPYTTSGYYPPATPTAAQLAEITANIASDGAYPTLMGRTVTVHAATFADITVSAKIYKAANYTAALVKANITEAIQKLFAVSNEERLANTLIDFGYQLVDNEGAPDYKIAWSHVLNAINDAEGVREVSFDNDNLLLNLSRQSVILQPEEFPRLSTITIYDMDDSGVQI